MRRNFMSGVWFFGSNDLCPRRMERTPRFDKPDVRPMSAQDGFDKTHFSSLSKRTVVGNAEQLLHRPRRPVALPGRLGQKILDRDGVLAPRSGQRR